MAQHAPPENYFAARDKDRVGIRYRPGSVPGRDARAGGVWFMPRPLFIAVSCPRCLLCSVYCQWYQRQFSGTFILLYSNC